MPDEVGVGRVGLGLGVARVEGHEDSGASRAADLEVALKLAGLHPAVAVGRAAVLHVDGVDHAVAVEPVGVAGRVEAGVGGVLGEDPPKLPRQLALDLQGDVGALVLDGRVGARVVAGAVEQVGHRGSSRAHRMRDTVGEVNVWAAILGCRAAQGAGWVL